MTHDYSTQDDQHLLGPVADGCAVLFAAALLVITPLYLFAQVLRSLFTLF